MIASGGLSHFVVDEELEAARAGEEGKGFAVVAMEVRNLADQNRDATVQVREILGEIQRATNAAVMVTEEGSKGVDHGQDLVNRAGGSIRDLAHAIEEAALAAMLIYTGFRLAHPREFMHVYRIGR